MVTAVVTREIGSCAVGSCRCAHLDLEVLLGERITLAEVPAALSGPLGAGRTVIVP